MAEEGEGGGGMTLDRCIVQTIGAASLYQGDCVDIMPSLPRVDAIITDPPYCSGAVSEAGRIASKGQGLRSENIAKLGWFIGDNMGTAGLVFLLRTMAFRALDILSPQGSMLVFCDWRMIPSLVPAIESSGMRYQNMIVWDKEMMGLGMGFRAQHEIVLHFTAGSPKYHDLGTANVVKAKRVGAGDREHQTQKPVDLMQRLIRVVCPPGGLVLDPFCGSGSTGVAAIAESRRFIGIERDPAHISTARERLSAAQAQRQLFSEQGTAQQGMPL